MAIKFTDAKKWDDVWFSELTMEQKVMFMYLCDSCDIAGFYEINEKIDSLRTGIEDVMEALQPLAKSVVFRDGYIWIKKHIKHQRNLPINPKNGAHKSIISCIADQIERFPEIYETLPITDSETIKNALMGGGGGSPSPSPLSRGTSISNSNSISNTVTTVTPQKESKIARLYKYFVGEENLLGQGITMGMRRILVEAGGVMDAEDWKAYCEARLKDEYKSAPNKFFLEDGWRKYQGSVKEVEKEKNNVEARRKEQIRIENMPEEEAPNEFKEFVKGFGKRITRDTETSPDTA